MAVDLDSGSGLMDRLGAMQHVINQINTHRGDESTAGSWPKELLDVLAMFNSASQALQEAVDDLLGALATSQTGVDDLLVALRTAAEDTLIEMVDADNPLDAPTTTAALVELIRQMEEANPDETVDASEPSLSDLITSDQFGDITAATQADPVEITSTAHGLAAGDRVSITGVAGMTEINSRTFTVTNVAANTFELLGEDGTGHTAYSSGGIWHANRGDGALVTSLLSGKGKTLENVLAEDIVGTIDTTTTAGREKATFAGEADRSGGDRLSFRWPSGSGASKQVTAIDAASTTGNVLTNSDFEDFTVADTPDDWTIDTGAAGTDVLQEASSVYKGSSSLEFVGDSSTLIAISQAITGLSSRTPYAFNFWTMVDVVPAAGVLQVDLYDGSNVINDDEGTANSFTITLADLETSFEWYSGVFRLPEPVPATVTLRIHLTTALSTGSSLFLDHAALAAMTELYAHGPYAALFSGASNFGKGDAFTITVANGREGALQEMFDRLFDMRSKALLLPSATGAGETIADSLIG